MMPARPEAIDQHWILGLVVPEVSEPEETRDFGAICLSGCAVVKFAQVCRV